MLRILFSSLALLATFAGQAQYDDLLRDRDIVWVAEYTTDFLMNPENENKWPSVNYLYPIRLQNSTAVNGLMGEFYCQQFLSEQIFVHRRRPGFKAYADSTLREELTVEALQARLVILDTAYQQCPVPLGPFLVSTDRVSSDISAFRIRQVFWYDAKRRRFGSRFLAYAPLVDVRDPEGNFLNRRQLLFWLKGEKKPPGRRKSRAVAYVFQTKMAENAPRAEDFRRVKGRLDFREIVRKEVNRPSRRWLSMENYQPISAAAMAAICFGTDTVVQYFYDTGEKTLLVPWDRIEAVERICFVQNWYYDDRRHRLYSRLLAWSPLSAIPGSDGRFLYHQPLFYQVYR